MASSLNSKRVFLMMMAAVGLLAAIVCIVALAAGVREATRERLFLVGSLLIVSLVCLVLSIHFKDATRKLDEAGVDSASRASADGEAGVKNADSARRAGDAVKRDAAQDTEQDLDDVALPQNRIVADAYGAAGAGNAGGYGTDAVRRARPAYTAAEDGPGDVHLPQNEA